MTWRFKTQANVGLGSYKALTDIRLARIWGEMGLPAPKIVGDLKSRISANFLEPHVK
jgi:hypothetical protein